MKPYEYGPAWHVRDSSWGSTYRSGFIAGHVNRTLNRDVIRVTLPDGRSGSAASLHAAKCLITRHTSKATA